MTTVEILKAARELISTPEKWTQMQYARDADGYSVEARSPQACRWCAVGAIRVACNFEEEDRFCDDQYVSAKRALRPHLGGASVSDFNDGHTHAEVLAAFDAAIATAESTP